VPHLQQCVTILMTAQVFRNASGNVNPAEDAGLRLNLKDFVTDNLCCDMTDSFLIPSATLCRFLDNAEIRVEKARQERGDVEQLVLGAKKRRRERTSAEEMHSEDDQRFKDQVRRVQARISEDDSSYGPSEPE